MNVADVVDRWAKKTPKAPALIYEGRVTSFAELNQQINRVANGLASLGVKPGDRVAIMLPNVPEFVFTFYGCLKLGAIAVPFNTMYKGGEISHILRDCKARVIVTLSNFVSYINELLPNLPDLEHIVTTGERNMTFVEPDATMFVQGVFATSTFPSVDEAYRRVGETLVEGFQELGLAGTWYKHRGSLRIGGHKLAGFMISEVEDVYILNMVCFLAPYDPSEFFSVVWVPPEIKDKAVEPVTSAAEHLGRRPTDEEFKQAVVRALEKRFGITLTEVPLSREEQIGYASQKAILARK